MNIENCKLWIEALRSGEYKQGKRKLCSLERNFCCLGVACEVAMKHGINIKTQWGTYGKHYNETCTGMPRVIALWLDIYTFEGFIRMNDTEGFTFNEIADFLEGQIREHRF